MKLNFEEMITNPVNIALLGIAAYLLYDYLKPVPKFTPKHPKVIVLKNYTPKELSKYNGENGERILLAVGGKVYDVSSKPDFYGPGSMYENFAGRDASRGMAKNSFDPEVLTSLDEPIDKLEGLSQEEQESLEEWSAFFAGKYQCVGELVNE